MNIKLTVLCENTVKTFSSLIGEHGFSCHIETDKNKFLLDTGQGLGILRNAALLRKNFDDLDGIILSHGHWDHTGGLEKILEVSTPKKVYAHPDIFKIRYSEKEDGIKFGGIRQRREHLEISGAEFIFYTDFTEIAEGIYLTGEVPRKNDFEINPAAQYILDENGNRVPDSILDDNTVVLDSPKGLVVVLGCAHAGIINILDYISVKLNKSIYAVIGGTHLKPANEDRLRRTIKILKEYNIQHIGVSHCTGPEKSATLSNEFKDKFFFANAGVEFCI